MGFASMASSMASTFASMAGSGPGGKGFQAGPPGPGQNMMMSAPCGAPFGKAPNFGKSGPRMLSAPTGAGVGNPGPVMLSAPASQTSFEETYDPNRSSMR